ncbi:RRNAD1 protein [Nymphaea thermarum]|nr:RRNAD1 protein [Nymphaea thermarum]
MDQEWLDCLCDEPVESLLRIPSGFVKDNWPVSLQEFVATARSLALPRERKNWQTALAFNFQPLDSVLSQGMNMKKKHEVEILSAVIKTIADDIGARTVIDVGAGQGYLAQVLSFQCKLPVVALDASPHHGTVTSSRAARIRKHYLSQAQKLNGSRNLNVPKTVTCNVLSSNVLTSFSATLCEEVDTLVENSGNDHGILSHKTSQKNASASIHESMNPSLLLAGLHACGNLSVNMLRTFLDCEEVKAVVSIGCCYNLLSEEQSTGDEQQCGFPLSHGVKSSGLILGKNARDLACQELIGPYWSLRAALGPLVETLILLDRLLFLQEQGSSVNATLFPLFDPIISPRNMAIIVEKAHGVPMSTNTTGLVGKGAAVRSILGLNFLVKKIYVLWYCNRRPCRGS